MQLDLTQFIGLTGVPFLEQIVQYLRNEWGMPTYLAPFIALLAGIAVNVGIGIELHQNLLTCLGMGLFTGFSTSYWHELTTAAK